MTNELILHPGQDFETQVGIKVGKNIKSTGKDGFLMFGPHRALKAGRYSIELFDLPADRATGSITVDFVSGGGLNRFWQARVQIEKTTKNTKDGLLQFEVNVANQVEDFEIRCFINSGKITLSKVVISDLSARMLSNLTESSLKLPKTQIKVLIVANCQGVGLANSLQAMSSAVGALPILATNENIRKIKSGELEISSLVAECDWILIQPQSEITDLFKTKFAHASDKIRLFPRILFPAFHPDADYVFSKTNSSVDSPIGAYQSTLALYGWLNNYSAEETVQLFNNETFEKLGYFNYWDISKKALTLEGKETNLPLDELINTWSRQGIWMYSMNHPRLFVMIDIAKAILAREGVTAEKNSTQYIQDDLVHGPAWPVYPAIANKIGVPGSYQFKKARELCPQYQPIQTLNLKDFIDSSFEIFSKFEREDLICHRLQSNRYIELKTFINKCKAIGVSSDKKTEELAPKTNPYQSLPDHQFWRRAIERPLMKDVDPVVKSNFKINRHSKVATAGSCFAQHISRTLQKNGFNYYITETSESVNEAQRRNFGVFSARYGNVYTARQLVQLFDRAYGKFTPEDQYWIRADGKLVDPFRPQIEPDGFDSVEDLEVSRSKHFQAVRQMFEDLDVLVFTLGLTEAWRSRVDGAVYPLAPGVIASEVDLQKHEFLNFRVSDVTSDMNAFIQRLLTVNPGARMLLTVSPVSLIATYEDRHVLVSTTYSKAVLRAAAEEITQQNPMCEYFPSYEIVTGNYTKGEYFDTDFRSVKPEGVDHVMRLFMSHYSSEKSIDETSSPAFDTGKFYAEFLAESKNTNEIVCDEEAIDKRT